jgi:hypothetical protein
MNELSWYEDTEICFTLDGDEVILSERENDWQTIHNRVWSESKLFQLWQKDLP